MSAIEGAAVIEINIGHFPYVPISDWKTFADREVAIAVDPKSVG